MDAIKRSKKTLINTAAILCFLLFAFLLQGFLIDNEKLFPNFKLTNLKGDTISNVDIAGKITVINIWATWCKPCINEMPELNKVVEHYKNDTSVLFIALTDDNIEKTKRFLETTSFNYQQIVGAEKLIGQLQFKIISARPQHLIVNQKGIIVSKKIGASDNISEYLIGEVEKYIKEE